MSIIEQAARRLEAVRPPELRPAAPARPDGTRVTLDPARLERLGILVPGRSRSPLVEEFRCIKRPLLSNVRADASVTSRRSLIVVTSALPGEGKTFSAINLALSIAMEIDTSVLLVDADALKPDLSRRLGFDASVGLLDLLAASSLDWRSQVLQTNLPRLAILPVGTANDMSTELLASAAMDRLLEAMAEAGRDHIVVFDAPPLLVSSDAKVLASRSGQVVLVVEAASTPRSAVAQALAELDDCEIVMSLLNKSHQPALPHGYGYGEG
jgi:protein-tyrosine kinase